MGNYIEKNLGKDERIIKQAEFHWSRLLWPILGCIVGAGDIIGCVNFLIDYSDDFLLFGLGLFSGFAGFAIFIVGLVFLIKIANTDVGFTNKNIIEKRGVIAQNLKVYPLEKIDSVEMKKSIFGRVFDCGTIIIKTAGTSERNLPVSFFGMKHSGDFKNALMEAIDNCKDEAAKKNAKALSEALGNKSNQISAVDEIKKLKELLDSGILSQEEFDAKKKQLLGL